MKIKLYYFFRFITLLFLIFITICAIQSFIPKSLSNDTPQPIIEHTQTLLTSQPKEPIYITSIILIDPVFSKIEIDTIKDALDRWVYATNGIINITYEVGYYPNMKIKLRKNSLLNIIRIKPTNENNPLINRIEALLQVPIVGYADIDNETNQDITTIYIVNGNIDNIEEYKTTVQHEFAHAGLKMLHLRDYSLMVPGADFASSYITQTDLKYFCYLYNCDAEQLNPYDPAPICSDTTFHLF
jgi:hypothetical protein